MTHSRRVDQRDRSGRPPDPAGETRAASGEMHLPGPVLVTGGNGYVASRVVKRLLEPGLDVHATVRDAGARAAQGVHPAGQAPVLEPPGHPPRPGDALWSRDTRLRGPPRHPLACTLLAVRYRAMIPAMSPKAPDSRFADSEGALESSK